jgi:hypothetical protein
MHAADEVQAQTATANTRTGKWAAVALDQSGLATCFQSTMNAAK